MSKKENNESYEQHGVTYEVEPIKQPEPDGYSDNMYNALDAMFSGNRVRFADNIKDIMADKIATAVGSRKEEMSQQVFGYNAADEDELETTEEETEFDDEDLISESVLDDEDAVFILEEIEDDEELYDLIATTFEDLMDEDDSEELDEAQKRSSGSYFTSVNNDAEGKAHLDLIRGIASHVNKHVVGKSNGKVDVRVRGRLGSDNKRSGEYKNFKNYSDIKVADAHHFDVYFTHNKNR